MGDPGIFGNYPAWELPTECSEQIPSEHFGCFGLPGLADGELKQFGLEIEGLQVCGTANGMREICRVLCPKPHTLNPKPFTLNPEPTFLEVCRDRWFSEKVMVLLLGYSRSASLGLSIP